MKIRKVERDTRTNLRGSFFYSESYRPRIIRTFRHYVKGDFYRKKRPFSQ